MWQINSRDILRFQGDDVRFVAFVDALLRATARAGGLGESEVIGNQRTRAPDGGVDTEVRQALPGASDLSGWMGEKTVWQYKAEEHSALSPAGLQQEIVGKSVKAGRAMPSAPATPAERYVVERLKDGYAYRLCISDELTPEKITEWEAVLAEQIQKVAPGAPAPRVVAADALAAWANHLPTVSVPHLRPELWNLRSYDQWGTNLTSVTSTFVDVDAWRVALERVANHVDFSKGVRSPVITVHGFSGVGKTRLVFEAVHAAAPLVVYTADEDEARVTAVQLAARADVRAVLIADECSLARRLDIARTLRGHEKRVRVVAIDNTSEQPAGQDDLWLQTISDETVARILEQNFPLVGVEMRQEFVRLSKGFVRLAADLCDHANEITAAGHHGPALRTVDDYLDARFRREPEQYRVLLLLALVDRLGWRRELVSELTALGALFGLTDVKRVAEVIISLNQRTGFVNVAGPYCYVTPEVVAESAFRLAWKRLVTDHDAFLAGLPAELVESFQRRVRRTTDAEVRRLVGAFFRRWAEGLTPTSLADRDVAVRLASLIEIAPETYLAVLRSLLDRASWDDLRSITSASVQGTWGARRVLVGLLETIVAFPEYFDDAEASLRRLAHVETEPGLGNNATSVWRALFLPLGSGTSVSFFERAPRLEALVTGGDDAVARMALGAVEGMLAPVGWRLVGLSVVAGRLRPEEWRPSDRDEFARCWRAAVDLLVLACKSPRSAVVEAARDVAVRQLRHLLREGFLSDLRAILLPVALDAARVSAVVDQAEEYTRFDANPEMTGAGAEDVRAWVRELTGSDLHGRLVAEVGLAPHLRRDRSDAGDRDEKIDAIATAFVARPELFEEERPFLASPQARSATALGEAVAHLDRDVRCLEAVMREVRVTRYTSLARGYLWVLLDERPDRALAVNEWLDGMESEVPAAVVELTMVHPEPLGMAARLLRAIRAGSLSVEYLGQLEVAALRRTLRAEDLREALAQLSEQQAHPAALRVAVSLIAACAVDDGMPEGGPLGMAEPETRALAWTLIRAALGDHGNLTHDWEVAVVAMGQGEPAEAIDVACLGLTADVAVFHEPSERILLTLSPRAPEAVVRGVARTLLDAQRGRRFYVGRYRGLIGGMPVPLVKEILAATGVEGARRLARHLSPPHLDREGRPVVPELTAHVLETFGDDERTFREFCMGGHGLQVYSGDIAAQHEHEAEVAREFLHHPLRRIREWAHCEHASAARQAEEWRERYALDAMP